MISKESMGGVANLQGQRKSQGQGGPAGQSGYGGENPNYPIKKDSFKGQHAKANVNYPEKNSFKIGDDSESKSFKESEINTRKSYKDLNSVSNTNYPAQERTSFSKGAKINF